MLSMLFWVLLSFQAQAEALPAKLIQKQESVPTLCETLNAKRIGDTPRFYTTMDTLSFLPYDENKGVLPLRVGPSWSALTGMLQIVSKESVFYVALPPEEAKWIQALAEEGKLSAIAAFSVESQREKPCEHKREGESSLYTFKVELEMVDLVRMNTGWPVLRYESERYTTRKEELKSRVLLTEPTILRGDISRERLRLAAMQLRPQLRSCYQKTKVAQGTLTLKVSIAEVGTVDWVDVTIDTLGDDVVTRCVQQSFSQSRFPPASRGGASVTLTMYFLEKP